MRTDRSYMGGATRIRGHFGHSATSATWSDRLLAPGGRLKHTYKQLPYLRAKKTVEGRGYYLISYDHDTIADLELKSLHKSLQPGSYLTYPESSPNLGDTGTF